MRTTLVLVLLSFPALVYSATSDESVLQQILTKEQYDLLKVDEMSSEQQAALVAALKSAFAIGQEKAIADTPPRVAAAPPAVSRDVVESQIDGDFDGWEGETIVKLMNGQIWQQSEYHYHYHYAFMPKVLIYKSGGGFKMKVDGVEKAVGVRQLK
jgi:hypothetical protein